MQTWAIVIFPQFAPEQRRTLDRIRVAYDPLAALIEPHITLVFPFETVLTSAEIVAHMRTCVVGLSPFAIELRGMTGQQDEWIFLNIKRGNDEIIALHDALYSGPLAPFVDARYTYTPHLTVGHLAPGEAFSAALHELATISETFQTKAGEITAYRVADEGTRNEKYAVVFG